VGEEEEEPFLQDFLQEVATLSMVAALVYTPLKSGISPQEEPSSVRVS